MAKITKCDMCGKDISTYSYSLIIENSFSLIGDIFPKERDLCESCKDKIIEMIDGKECEK